MPCFLTRIHSFVPDIHTFTTSQVGAQKAALMDHGDSNAWDKDKSVYFIGKVRPGVSTMRGTPNEERGVMQKS